MLAMLKVFFLSSTLMGNKVFDYVLPIYCWNNFEKPFMY